MIDPAKAFRLDGKAALVTGGTRGIGRAIAEGFVAAGAAVCVMARKQDELDETLAALGSVGPAVTVYAGSAGDPPAIEAGVAHCVNELGGLDILVNNAGTNPTFGPMIETEPRAVRKVLEVNLEGPLLLAQAAWRSWMRDHGGVVINVASLGGIRPSLGIGMYNTSKAALVHMTRQLAVELAPGVRVNALAPGLVKTHFARALFEHDEEGTAAQFPMKRLGVPDDCAGAALFLASDASSWMTGDVIVVDGGGLVGGP
ncbi:MAG TPA: SDR family oxidoreductase [Acidimicrobiia bacterium]|nr:SDR family oxidoreductase [Acidimicrobiia bacterium]